MKVIGAGFGRTGTASLKLALEALGLGPCYHMFEVLERPERARDWAALADGAPPDWERIFAGYQATVDWPGTAFWRQLVDAYPEAKVILTVRDPERWYDSVASTIFARVRRASTPSGRLLTWLAAVRSPHMREFIPAVRKVVWDGTFDGRFADRDHAIEVFRRHNDEVRRLVSPDRLLVYEVGEGWGPLCAFLGVPVPDTPFPWVNDAASFRDRQRRELVRTLAVPAATLGAAALAIAAARRRVRASRG